MGDLNKPNINIGMLAHVDAGKTTLSEALLYKTGTIRKLGRVDTRDAFLDTNKQERARGITIFSKQAVVELEKARITLLDTPGHVDFSAEISLKANPSGVRIFLFIFGLNSRHKALIFPLDTHNTILTTAL